MSVKCAPCEFRPNCDLLICLIDEQVPRVHAHDLVRQELAAKE